MATYRKIIDSEVLIDCVFQRPAVWDRNSKMYSSRKIVDKDWSEISKEMECDENDVRKKWKYLRVQFGVELGKIQQSGDYSNDPQASKWRYFEQLVFLKGIVKPRLTAGFSACKEETPEFAFVKEEHDIDEEETPRFHPESGLLICSKRLKTDDYNQSIIDTSQSKFPKTDPYNECILEPSHNKLSKVDDYNQTILDTERQKLLENVTENQNKEEDEDLMFFKSLLSHVKKIPDSKKLSFRNRIQEVVDQFAYKNG